MPAFDINKETIGSILKTKKNLRVPVNQRSYGWKQEHVEDLYKDITGAMQDQSSEYFLGSIIVVDDGRSVEVYDGQQRIATSMILIAAIRDYFLAIGDEKSATSTANEFLQSIHRSTHDLLPHFQLSAEDHQYFVNSVLRAPNDPARRQAAPDETRESHKLIRAAAKYAAKHVLAITDPVQPEERPKTLHRILDFLEERARVILVQVADEPTAFRVFETMNDRGLKLSAADLLKNYIYALAGEKKELAVIAWKGVVSSLESLGSEDGAVVDFVRYYWVTSHGPTRTNDLFDAIKKEVNSKGSVISFVDKLQVASQKYVAILTPTHEAWAAYPPEVRASVETLRLLGVSQIRPLLLAAYDQFSSRELGRLLQASVNWSVRCLLSGVPSGTLEGHYSRRAKEVTTRQIRNVLELTNELSAIIPNDDRFRDGVRNASVANASLARYYLRCLQHTADGNHELQYVVNDGESVTLEHILPLNPGPGWEHIAEEDVRAYRNRLGNQALLQGSVNNKIGNVSFDAKRDALRESPFSLTRYATSSAQWDIYTIVERQNHLADLAIKCWPLRIP